MKFAIALSVVAIGLYGMHRALSWAAERGWIYYGEHHRQPGGNFNFLAGIYQPSMEHVIEEQQRVRVMAEDQEAGEGDPPIGIVPPS